jgi:hypothetical protein
MSVKSVTTNSQPSHFGLAVKAGFVAAAAAALLAGHLPEPVIVLGVILIASCASWHRAALVPARVRSQHRFTVVSRSGDEFVTVDANGARRISRTLSGTISADGTPS